MLGCALIPLLRSRGHAVLCHGYSHPADFNADLTSYAEAAEILSRSMPEIIINLAALTNVDTCETNPHDAYLLNVRTVENLCRWIKQENPRCHLIQLSTDQVYDGDGPHSESDITIRNSYAFSKIAAELAASSISSTILRTNFFGRSQCAGRPSFTDWLYDALKHNKSIKVFDDVLFSPLSINTLTDLIEQSIQKLPQGIFNLGSADGMSKADFAYAFAQTLELPTGAMARSRSTEMQSLHAYRPKDMRMDSSHFEQRMELRLPKLIDEITSIRSEYLEQT